MGHGCEPFSNTPGKMSTNTQQTPDDFPTQLRAFRRERGITQEALAERLNITRSYLSQVENGEPCSPRLQAKFREVAGRSENVESVLGKSAQPNNRDIPMGDEIVQLRLIPLVSWAQAGQAVDFEELPPSWQKMVPTDVADPRAFAVTIVGNSMEPRHHEGDVATLTPSEPLRQNDKVIANLKDQGVVFKLYSRSGNTIRLSSLNPAYAPYEVPVEEIVWIYPVYSVLEIVYK